MALEQVRNLGIVAHIDAGKTTVSERILFYTGVERRMGEVHEGSAVMDWMPEERKRGITITSAATSVPWRGHTIHLIDTPGHVDFTVEVERCMRVLDGAVLVLNGVAGVQAQSETVWRQMRRHGVRAVAFVNQLDRAGADFFQALEDLKARLDIPAIPVQYPLGVGRGFRAIVDLLTGQAFEFPEESQGREPRLIPVPPEVADEVAVLRAELLEALAEGDEELLEAYLGEEDPDPALLRRVLRDRTLAGTLVPVLAGAALRNVGIQPLLDAVVDYLPSPRDLAPVEGRHAQTGESLRCEPDAEAPFAALAFKLASDAHEDLLFCRIYSGRVRPGDRLLNTRLGQSERIARVLRMHADHREPLEEAEAGDIVALSGFKLSRTGDTLADPRRPVQLERPTFPEPVLTRVVEPRATDDRDKLRTALERLAFEDPTFHVREDVETGQWLIAGMGELHLEILEHRLEGEFGLGVRVGRPRVAYREAARTASTGTARVERVLGGSKVFGAVTVELCPLELGSPTGDEGARGAEVVWSPDCLVPETFRRAMEQTLVLEAQVGPCFGFPLLGLRLTLCGGESHPGADAELGFVQAASQALRSALALADVTLMEPEMSFEVEAPADFMSGILGELNAKKADIRELSADGALRRVRGHVPLYAMFGWATTLRSLSQGRAGFTLRPAGFRPVPEGELAGRGLVSSS